MHARLAHANIVTFYNATELDGQFVMTSELVEGTALAGRLELGPMPWPKAVTWANQILSALSYAHAHGVVHRDLTPANIILTPEGTARLTGFGLAKGTADPQLTVVGTIVGSVKYISPEQVDGIRKLDGRTDIYSAGVVLYESLTGRPPFDGKGQFEILLAHMKNAPAPPSAMNPSVPKEFDPILLKALAKDPDQRFRTADEFRESLEAATVAIENPVPKASSERLNPKPESGVESFVEDVLVQPATFRAATAQIPSPFPAPDTAVEPVYGGFSPSRLAVRPIMFASAFMVFVAAIAFFALR